MKGIDTKDQAAFSQFLVSDKKVLSSKQLETCLKVQKAMSDLGILSTLDKIIIEKGYLDANLVHELIKEYKGGDEGFVPGYRIISKLGEGAMGEVYKAVDIENGQEVAIKVLFPHLGKKKSTAKRFLQEAEICKKLNHPNIVKGYEVGYEADQDFYFYVMEYVEGTTLSRYLRDKGVFEETLLIKIGLEIASALEQATMFNLVHRDIKPDNIILTKEENAKLCDLGLARNWAQDLSLTLTGAVMGTPFYISPEAAKGIEELDSRSDIYSLGATLFHIAVGRVPFPAKTSMEVLDLHKSDKKITPPIQIRSDISPGLSAIIQKMMAKSPSVRYQNPRELITDFKLLQEGQKPSALTEVISFDSVLSTTENKISEEEKIKIQNEMYRQSGVQEHSIHTSRQALSKKGKAISLFDNFFTSTEQRVLSSAKWKLVVLIMSISLALFISIILIIFLIKKILF